MIVPTNPMRMPPRMPMQPLGSEASYALNRRSENVVVKAVIIAELKLRDIEMKVLFVDVVEGADDPALEDAPKALNRLSVYRADDIPCLAWSTVPCGKLKPRFLYPTH